MTMPERISIGFVLAVLVLFVCVLVALSLVPFPAAGAPILIGALALALLLR